MADDLPQRGCILTLSPSGDRPTFANENEYSNNFRRLFDACLIDPNRISPFNERIAVNDDLAGYCAGIVGEGVRLLNRREYKQYVFTAAAYLQVARQTPDCYRIAGSMIWSDDPSFWDDYIAWGKGPSQLATFEIHYEFDQQSHWKRSLIHFGDTLLDGRIKYHRPPRQKYLEYAERICKQRPAHNEYWAIVVEVTVEG